MHGLAVQEPDEAPVDVTIGAASFEQSEIKRLPTRLLHRLEARAFVRLCHRSDAWLRLDVLQWSCQGPGYGLGIQVGVGIGV